MESYSIWAEGLTKTYAGSGNQATVAVNNISIKVAPGEFYGFLGPNGAGKSTTIKMLTGLLRPTAGRIVIASHDLATEPLEVKRFIGVLPEDLNLYERLSAPEMLIFAAQMYGIPKTEARRRTDDLLELMELTDAGSKMIVDFSMGMKKKAALAAAMIHSPPVLFLDEPFNGIDALSGKAIRDVLRTMTSRGTTIFFSSHVMEVVERLCSRIAIIARGSIVAEGTLEELRTGTGHSSATLEDLFVELVGGQGREDAGVTDDLRWLNSESEPRGVR